jgi:hypothetical protein
MEVAHEWRVNRELLVTNGKAQMKNFASLHNYVTSEYTTQVGSYHEFETASLVT